MAEDATVPSMPPSRDPPPESGSGPDGGGRRLVLVVIATVVVGLAAGLGVALALSGGDSGSNGAVSATSSTTTTTAVTSSSAPGLAGGGGGSAGTNSGGGGETSTTTTTPATPKPTVNASYSGHISGSCIAYELRATTITWTSQNATSVDVNSNYGQANGQPANGDVSIQIQCLTTPSGSVNVTVTAHGPGGDASTVVVVEYG